MLGTMKSARPFAIVLVTVPNLQTARKLARLALEARFVACANIVSNVESHYWWRGKIERSSERLVLFKAAAARMEDLEKLVLSNHPYDTPEIVTLPLAKSTERYLAWLRESTS